MADITTAITLNGDAAAGLDVQDRTRVYTDSSGTDFEVSGSMTGDRFALVTTTAANPVLEDATINIDNFQWWFTDFSDATGNQQRNMNEAAVFRATNGAIITNQTDANNGGVSFFRCATGSGSAGGDGYPTVDIRGTRLINDNGTANGLNLERVNLTEPVMLPNPLTGTMEPIITSFDGASFEGFWFNTLQDIPLIGVDFSRAGYRDLQSTIQYSIRMNPRLLGATTATTWLIGSDLSSLGTFSTGRGMSFRGDNHEIPFWFVDCATPAAGSNPDGDNPANQIVYSFESSAFDIEIVMAQAWRPQIRAAGVVVPDGKMKLIGSPKELFPVPADGTAIDRTTSSATSTYTSSGDIINATGYFVVDSRTDVGGAAGYGKTQSYTDLSGDVGYALHTYTHLSADGTYQRAVDGDPNTNVRASRVILDLDSGTEFGKPNAIDELSAVVDEFLNSRDEDYFDTNPAITSADDIYPALKADWYNDNTLTQNWTLGGGAILTFDRPVTFAATTNYHTAGFALNSTALTGNSVTGLVFGTHAFDGNSASFTNISLSGDSLTGIGAITNTTVNSSGNITAGATANSTVDSTGGSVTLGAVTLGGTYDSETTMEIASADTGLFRPTGNFTCTGAFDNATLMGSGTATLSSTDGSMVTATTSTLSGNADDTTFVGNVTALNRTFTDVILGTGTHSLASTDFSGGELAGTVDLGDGNLTNNVTLSNPTITTTLTDISTWSSTGTATITAATNITINVTEEQGGTDGLGGTFTPQGVTFNVVSAPLTKLFTHEDENGTWAVRNNDVAEWITTPVNYTKGGTPNSVSISNQGTLNYTVWWKRDNDTSNGWDITSEVANHENITNEDPSTLSSSAIASVLYDGTTTDGTSVSVVDASTPGSLANTNDGIEVRISSSGISSSLGGPSQYLMLQATNHPPYLKTYVEQGLTSAYIVPSSGDSTSYDARYVELNTGVANAQQTVVAVDASPTITSPVLTVVNNDGIILVPNQVGTTGLSGVSVIVRPNPAGATPGQISSGVSAGLVSVVTGQDNIIENQEVIADSLNSIPLTLTKTNKSTFNDTANTAGETILPTVAP